MPRAYELIQIPDSLWQRPDTIAALRSRDIGRFFALVSQNTGASQTQIGIACGLSQGKVSDIIRGVQQVEKLERFERIADGLGFPDPARMLLGLAPWAASHLPTSARLIPSRDTGAALPESPGSTLLSLVGDRQEDDPVRRRTFLGLTGTTMVGAMLDDVPQASAAINAEPLAPVLAGHLADPSRPRDHRTSPP